MRPRHTEGWWWDYRPSQEEKETQVDLCHSLGPASVGSSNLYSEQPLRRCLFTAQIDNYSL